MGSIFLPGKNPPPIEEIDATRLDHEVLGVVPGGGRPPTSHSVFGFEAKGTECSLSPEEGNYDGGKRLAAGGCSVPSSWLLSRRRLLPPRRGDSGVGCGVFFPRIVRGRFLLSPRVGGPLPWKGGARLVRGFRKTSEPQRGVQSFDAWCLWAIDTRDERESRIIKYPPVLRMTPVTVNVPYLGVSRYSPLSRFENPTGWVGRSNNPTKPTMGTFSAKEQSWATDPRSNLYRSRALSLSLCLSLTHTRIHSTRRFPSPLFVGLEEANGRPTRARTKAAQRKHRKQQPQGGPRIRRGWWWCTCKRCHQPYQTPLSRE